MFVPWDPHRCPPGVLWLMTQHGTRVDSIKLFHLVPAPVQL
jgi:hypothetical protein